MFSVNAIDTGESKRSTHDDESDQRMHLFRKKKDMISNDNKYMWPQIDLSKILATFLKYFP